MSLKHFCFRIQDLEAIDRHHYPLIDITVLCYFIDFFGFKGYNLGIVDVNMCTVSQTVTIL